MARIVILGAGLGGVPMAFEMKETVGKNHDVIVISDSPTFHFVPSNPWVPPKWRTPQELKIELAPVFKKKGIEFIQKAAAKVDPVNNQVQLDDSSTVAYDFLIIYSRLGKVYRKSRTDCYRCGSGSLLLWPRV